MPVSATKRPMLKMLYRVFLFKTIVIRNRLQACCMNRFVTFSKEFPVLWAFAELGYVGTALTISKLYFYESQVMIEIETKRRIQAKVVNWQCKIFSKVNF